jgi:ADP-ribose pyrophosphatase YjhB (NUDIX family)
MTDTDRGSSVRGRDALESVMTNVTSPAGTSWLTPEELDAARQRVPILYIDAIPVRTDVYGAVTAIGLLLRANQEGRISRSLVSGRVLYQERVRNALMRHLEKDLGPLALPRIPSTPQPFTVAEYFPTPGVTAFHDPRQHAVSLAFVVPVEGDCEPQQDALDLAWFDPDEARAEVLLAEMSGGQDVVLRQGLSHMGY